MQAMVIMRFGGPKVFEEQKVLCQEPLAHELLILSWRWFS
jgi:hypothetical protein